mgnify:CR=1 FL=1
MQPKQFKGTSLQEAMAKVRREMGDDAMVLSTRTGRGKSGPWVEIQAATATDVEAYRKRMAGPPSAAKTARTAKRIGPRIMALVGPAGSGKTLTAVKMALSNHAFGKERVGFITLDTFKVGGVEELQTYAELAGVPLEVVYNRKEIASALQRLRTCDAIVVDTPGRVPGAMGVTAPWESLLKEMDPDEIHLVIPAGLRTDVARYLKASFRNLGVTHVLPSKLDEVLGDAGLAELVEQVDLPTRWVADGQEVPGDLRPAGTRILSSLGQSVGGLRKGAVTPGQADSGFQVRAG